MYRLPKLDGLPKELREKVMRDYSSRVIRRWRSPRALLVGSVGVTAMILVMRYSPLRSLPPGLMRSAITGGMAGGIVVLFISLVLARPMRESYRRALAANG